MAIQSLNDYIASQKQLITLCKTATRTSVATGDFSVFDLAGAPGAGTLSGSSVAAGVVPTDADAGYPVINAFSGGSTGGLSRVMFSNTVPCRISLFDRLWLGGAYPFNASQTLAAQPSYVSRVPGSDYKNLQIWVETVTAFTGNLTVAVTYTNEGGTGTRTTGTFAPGVAPTLGRCFQLPLQAGDSGVQKIDSVTSTIASVGTFNVMVLRPLGDFRVNVANDGCALSMLETGMPQIYANSALYMIVTPYSTSTGTPYLRTEVASG